MKKLATVIVGFALVGTTVAARAPRAEARRLDRHISPVTPSPGVENRGEELT